MQQSLPQSNAVPPGGVEIVSEPDTTEPDADRLPRWRSVPAQAAAIWGAYWLLLAATGQPIDLRPVYAGWQNLPVEALRAAPISSLFDLHIQPPLWNVVIGFAVGWSPFTTTFSMGIVLFVSGCVLAASVAAVLCRLGVSRRWTLVITAAATMNTHLLVYAFNAGYDISVAALLGLLMWIIVGTRRTSAAWYGVAATTTTIALTRSLYHPVWALLVLAIVGWELRKRLTKRQVLLGLLIPAIGIGGWIGVNGVRHGEPTLSSWTGMNLLRSVYPTVSKSDLREMYDDGDISGIALSGPFRAYSAYEPYLGECEPQSDDLALTIATRPIPPHLRVPGRFYSEQAPNFNYECYIDAYHLAGSDAWAIMRRQPQDWVKARIWASDNWFEAPPVYEPKRSPLWRPTDFATGIVYVRVPHPPLPESWKPYDLWIHGSPQTAMVGLNWLLGFIAVCIYGWHQWRGRRAVVGASSGGDPTEPCDDDPDDDRQLTVASAHGDPDATSVSPTASTATAEIEVHDPDPGDFDPDDLKPDDLNPDDSNPDDLDADGGEPGTAAPDDDPGEANSDQPTNPPTDLSTDVVPVTVVDSDWALRRRTLIAVMGMTLAWTAFAGIFIELGEQGRFRAVTDPFVLSAVAVMNWRWYWPRVQAWWNRRSADATDSSVVTADSA